MQPSEIMKFEYWEYEQTLEELSQYLKDKNEAEKKAYGDQKKDSPNMSGMMKKYKTPSMPKFRMPSTK